MPYLYLKYGRLYLCVTLSDREIVIHAKNNAVVFLFNIISSVYMAVSR